jgi:hypothetical protein
MITFYETPARSDRSTTDKAESSLLRFGLQADAKVLADD